MPGDHFWCCHFVSILVLFDNKSTSMQIMFCSAYTCCFCILSVLLYAAFSDAVIVCCSAVLFLLLWCDTVFITLMFCSFLFICCSVLKLMGYRLFDTVLGLLFGGIVLTCIHGMFIWRCPSIPVLPWYCVITAGTIVTDIVVACILPHSTFCLFIPPEVTIRWNGSDMGIQWWCDCILWWYIPYLMIYILLLLADAVFCCWCIAVENYVIPTTVLPDTIAIRYLSRYDEATVFIVVLIPFAGDLRWSDTVFFRYLHHSYLHFSHTIYIVLYRLVRCWYCCDDTYIYSGSDIYFDTIYCYSIVLFYCSDTGGGILFHLHWYPILLIVLLFCSKCSVHLWKLHYWFFWYDVFVFVNIPFWWHHSLPVVWYAFGGLFDVCSSAVLWYYRVSKLPCLFVISCCYLPVHWPYGRFIAVVSVSCVGCYSRSLRIALPMIPIIGSTRYIVTYVWWNDAGDACCYRYYCVVLMEFLPVLWWCCYLERWVNRHLLLILPVVQTTFVLIWWPWPLESVAWSSAVPFPCCSYGGSDAFLWGYSTFVLPAIITVHAVIVHILPFFPC